MDGFSNVLFQYLQQAQTTDLKTSSYPKLFADLNVRVSFGMGAPARIPWLAFIRNEMRVSNGFYPVYLYYKEQGILILSYGVSETTEFATTWPREITDSCQTIQDYFGVSIPRYGDSHVFKAYKVMINQDSVQLFNAESGEPVTSSNLDLDLQTILTQYQQCFDLVEHAQVTSNVGIGLFYMEKQLEDFIISNWDKTDLGKRFDLIVKDGELLSQQYRTDIGPIDILVKDKVHGNYVVIELKRNQTSDDTLGQLARYMGWVKEKLKDPNVKGIIIAGAPDIRLDYAMKMMPNIEVFTYKVDFVLQKVN